MRNDANTWQPWTDTPCSALVRSRKRGELAKTAILTLVKNLISMNYSVSTIPRPCSGTDSLKSAALDETQGRSLKPVGRVCFTWEEQVGGNCVGWETSLLKEVVWQRTGNISANIQGHRLSRRGEPVGPARWRRETDSDNASQVKFARVWPPFASSRWGHRKYKKTPPIICT